MTATQAPTPGPMDSESVKLLVKGDLTLCADRIIRAVEQVDVERGVVWFTDGEASGPSVLTFIGRPDADGWMPWSGGENPVPGQMAEIRFRSGEVESGAADHFDWSHEARRGKPLSRSLDIIAFRLAPTAPVEASGSERELLARATHGEYSLHNFPDDPDADHSLWSIFHTTDSGGMEVASGMDHATADFLLAALRPQPSGETRAAVARIIDTKAWATRDAQYREIERSTRIEDKLTARMSADAYVYDSLRLADRILSLIRPAPGRTARS